MRTPDGYEKLSTRILRLAAPRGFKPSSGVPSRTATWRRKARAVLKVLSVEVESEWLKLEKESKAFESEVMAVPLCTPHGPRTSIVLRVKQKKKSADQCEVKMHVSCDIEMWIFYERDWLALHLAHCMDVLAREE